MKYLITIVIFYAISANAVLASDFCKQRAVKQCDMSGINCQLVVICD